MTLARAAVATILFSLTAAGADAPAARRAALLALHGPPAIVVPRLAQALGDPDPVTARTAVRLLGGQGPTALAALTGALSHRDPLVRRSAALGLGGLGPAALPALAKALADPAPAVRSAAALAVNQVRPRSAQTAKLLAVAAADADATVRDMVLDVTRTQFRVIAEYPLPTTGWRLRADPDDVGRREGWFKPELDDSAWTPSSIGDFWGSFGPNLLGVAWYRGRFELPARPAPARVELAFGAVDESAWVWLNGRSVGEHDVGPNGWDQPFALDVTGQVTWGGTTAIAVRVLNTAMAGGIWKPVTVRVLEPAP